MLIRLTNPTTEPITLEQAMDHLRVDDSTDAGLIDAMISAARDACERYCNRAWAQANFMETFDRFPESGGIKLTDPGAEAVLGVEYLDADGTPGVISASSLSLDTDMGIIDYGASWPVGATRVKVSYTAGPDAGASTPELPPPSIVLAIKLLLTDYYENRGAQQWQQLYTNQTAEALMYSYRVGLGV